LIRRHLKKVNNKVRRSRANQFENYSYLIYPTKNINQTYQAVIYTHSIRASAYLSFALISSWSLQCAVEGGPPRRLLRSSRSIMSNRSDWLIWKCSWHAFKNRFRLSFKGFKKSCSFVFKISKQIVISQIVNPVFKLGYQSVNVFIGYGYQQKK
jgi:hypothetical protein